MATAENRVRPRLTRQDWIHSIRTTLGAVISLEIARLFKLPEAYWASITAIILMQSTLGAALTVSEYRLARTALGAAMGALLGTYFPPNVWIYAAGILVLGIICATLRLDRAAYRFAGITLAIVLLVTRVSPAWEIALHRFFEVSVGIGVGLILTAIWPGDGPAGPAGR
ncbi:MAG: FUSC family protein [Candidatus Acidiferrales bacterium]